MPQNPFKVEVRLADSEEIQTDFEVQEPDGSIQCADLSLEIGRQFSLRAPTVPYLSSFNYLPPVLAQRPHLERGAGRAFAG